MADRQSIAAMRRQMYVPEERPGYEEFIADPENQRRAEEVALNLAMLGLGPLGEIPAGLRLAKNLYSGYRGLSGAEQALLPRPDRGNAMRLEEMLPSAPPAQQSVPPFRSPGRLEYSPPTRSTRDDRMGRLEGEGGLDPQALIQSQRARAEREGGEKLADVSRLEGEGGVTADTIQMARDVHNRRIAQERAQREMELARFEGEGGREGRSFSRDFTFEGSPYYNYPSPVRYNEPGMPVGSGRPVSNETPLFAQGERGMSSMPGGGLPSIPRQYLYSEADATALPPGGPRLAGSQFAGESPAYGASFRPNLTDRTNGTSILPTTMAVLNDPNRPGLASGPSAISPEDLFDMRNAETSRYPSAEDRAAYNEQQQIGSSQRYPSTRPTPARSAAPARPAPERAAQVQEAAANPANMTLRKLWEAANESGEARDFFRADQAMQSAIKRGEDIGYYGQSEGKKAGGSVNGKDAAVHKALEIIHHMITNR
jgi:hypothetical protein